MSVSEVPYPASVENVPSEEIGSVYDAYKTYLSSMKYGRKAVKVVENSKKKAKALKKDLGKLDKTREGYRTLKERIKQHERTVNKYEPLAEDYTESKKKIQEAYENGMRCEIVDKYLDEKKKSIIENAELVGDDANEIKETVDKIVEDIKNEDTYGAITGNNSNKDNYLSRTLKIAGMFETMFADQIKTTKGEEVLENYRKSPKQEAAELSQIFGG